MRRRVPDAVQRFLTVYRRAGTYRRTASSMDPGSAAHHAQEWRAAQHPGHANTSPPSRGAMRPSCAGIVRPEIEGVGNAGCPLHPQPRARSVVSTRVSHHEFTGITRHSRTRMVLTVSFALLCRALLSPSPADHSADLTPTIEASGPHDFAVRKMTRSSVAPPASIASLPYVRDDRETPLCLGPGWRGI